ncbi:hypothetical protein LCGC14_0344380 [marine sediment metagenome]|uniref:Uncharacterized protein n=1 Tax=marine sediment metagenome TaxID=412755 RepID=A0A0F9TVH6_9ZZZZ
MILLDECTCPVCGIVIHVGDSTRSQDDERICPLCWQWAFNDQIFEMASMFLTSHAVHRRREE